MQPRPSSDRFEHTDTGSAGAGGNGRYARGESFTWHELDPAEEDLRVAWALRLRRILTSLAGMDAMIMSNCPRHEQAATWKLGLTLAIPFLLALLAGTYTITTLTESRWIGFVCGVVWAAVVLSIDLAVMPTLTYTSMAPIGRVYRNTRAARLNAWLRGLMGTASVRRSALLRIGMAVVLGGVMSHTLVMGIFYQRIFSEIELDRVRELASIDQEWKVQEIALQERQPTQPKAPPTTLDESVGDKEKVLGDLRTELAAHHAEIDAADKEIAQQRESAVRELQNGTFSGKGAGNGPFYESMQIELDRLVKKRNDLTRLADETSASINSARTALASEQGNRTALQQRNRESLEAQRQVAMQKWQKEYDEARRDYEKHRDDIEHQPRNDLLYQTEYFHRIIVEHVSTLILALGIFAAVFIIDLVPLLLKFFRSPAAYDAWVAWDQERCIRDIRSSRYYSEDAGP